MQSLEKKFFLGFQTNQVFNIHLMDVFYLKNNGVPARYSPREIRGRILAAESPIAKDLGRILAPRFRGSRRDSRQDFGRRDSYS